jgi:hypothetical protein
VTGLGRWLAGILNAHIERHNVEPPPRRPLATAAPREHGNDTVDLSHLGVTVEQAAEVLRQRVADLVTTRTALLAGEHPPAHSEPVTVRCCWACGDPRGFHAVHRPCWNVPTFTRNADQVQRTYGAGGLL